MSGLGGGFGGGAGFWRVKATGLGGTAGFLEGSGGGAKPEKGGSGRGVPAAGDALCAARCINSCATCLNGRLNGKVSGGIERALRGQRSGTSINGP